MIVHCPTFKTDFSYPNTKARLYTNPYSSHQQQLRFPLKTMSVKVPTRRHEASQMKNNNKHLISLAVFPLAPMMKTNSRTFPKATITHGFYFSKYNFKKRLSVLFSLHAKT